MLLRLLLSFFVSSVLCYSSCYSTEIDTTKYKSVQDLIAEKKIEAEITGIGGHSGNCIQFKTSNNTRDSIFIWVEAGRRLGSEDSTEQDILVMKNKLIALGPLQSDSTEIFGFCCQSHNSSPKSKSKFKIGVMAPLAWVILANFVDQHDFPVSAIQAAVWVLSDNHELGSIHDADPEKIRPLKEKVAKLLNIETPWYSYTYHPNEEGQLFSTKYHKVHGFIEFYLNTNAVLSIFIRDELGREVCKVLPEGNYGPGEYKLELKQDITGWAKGRYTVYVIQDHSFPLKKQSFVIR